MSIGKSAKASEDAISIILTKLRLAEAHKIHKDPEQTPYASRYLAIEVYKEILDQLNDDITFESLERAKAFRAFIHFKIGSLHWEVEDYHDADESLRKSILIADEVENEDLVTLTKIRTFNMLGILWSFRGNNEMAGEFLDIAVELYQKFNQELTDHVFTAGNIEDLIRGPKTSPDDEDPPDSMSNEKIIDEIITTLYFTRAQVFQKLNKLGLAAADLQTTLDRQLQVKSYVPVDWAINASNLALFFIKSNQFHASKRILSAALVVCDEGKPDDNNEDFEDLNEKYLYHRSCLLRMCGRYALSLLEYSNSLTVGEETNQDHQDDFRQNPLYLQYPELEVSHNPAKNFEEAREIFMFGKKCLIEAKNYFTLNEHCVGFVEINQSLCSLHLCLEKFEDNGDRQYQILKRAAELLDTPLKELNPAKYLVICRQLTYQLGEIYYDMMDVKMAKLDLGLLGDLTYVKSKESLIKNINQLVKLGKHAFSSYLDLTQPESGSYTSELLRPALLAMLNLARLASKTVVVPKTDASTIQNSTEALKYYKMFSEYCETHEDAKVLMEMELELCNEMIIMISTKVERMRLQS